jgi:hypothetical protein
MGLVVVFLGFVMMGSMCITGRMPALHARFVCPPSQASKPIMALRRFLPLDTSMAQPGLDTDAAGSRSGRCFSPHHAALFAGDGFFKANKPKY